MHDVDGVLVGASIHAEKHQIAVRDFDYTDYEAVPRFAVEFADSLA